MKTLFQSALALTVITVVVMSMGSGCNVEDDATNDVEATDKQGSSTTLARYAYAPELRNAIDARHALLVADDAALTAEYFAEPLTDVETTADNGVRQLWTGDFGVGAIYAHPRRTHGAPHLVYGEIYALWEQNGAEAWSGYPLGDEHDAGWGCAADGALREQAFTPGIEAPGYHRALCWAPGRLWTYEWVDDGAGLQRLPPVQRGPQAS